MDFGVEDLAIFVSISGLWLWLKGFKVKSTLDSNNVVGGKVSKKIMDFASHVAIMICKILEHLKINIQCESHNKRGNIAKG
jgi:hypothetical protein